MLISGVALTKDELPTTDRASLNVTAKNVILSLTDATIMTRLAVSSPIFSFLAVTETLPLDTPDYNRGLQLCCFNLSAHGARGGLTPN